MSLLEKLPTLKHLEQCGRCDKVIEAQLKLKIFTTDYLKSQSEKNKRIPKWIFHIQAYCPDCGYIKNITQTPEVIRIINDWFYENKIN